MAVEPYLLSVHLDRGRVRCWEEHPFNIPAVRHLDTLPLHPDVTFFIGENGSGKSTLLEGVAVMEGFNAEGGTRNFGFSTKNTHSESLPFALGVSRGPRGKLRRDGFFLRAESFYNVASYVEELEAELPANKKIYGDKSLHAQSHGESFLTLLSHRLTGGGLYLFDEPEAALSPQRQLSFLVRLRELVELDSQFVIATHSPIIMAYPDAWIYEFSDKGIRRVEYQQTEHYKVTYAFMTRRERMLKDLLDDLH